MLVFLYVVWKKIKKKYKDFKEDLEWKSLGEPKKELLCIQENMLRVFLMMKT